MIKKKKKKKMSTIVFVYYMMYDLTLSKYVQSPTQFMPWSCILNVG